MSPQPLARRDDSGSESSESSAHERKKKRKHKEKSKKEKKEKKKEKKKKKKRESERSASAATTSGATAASAASATAAGALAAAPLHRPAASASRPINPMLGFMRPLSTGFLGDRAGQMAGRGFGRSNAYHQSSEPAPVLSNLEKLSREADEAERDAKRARRQDPMAQLERAAL